MSEVVDVLGAFVSHFSIIPTEPQPRSVAVVICSRTFENTHHDKSHTLHSSSRKSITMQATRALRMVRPTARMMRPVPKEEQGAHTISQRLRTLKKIPVELLPIGAVVAVAIGFGVYSLSSKLFDGQMRLSRQNRQH
ncbi:hypothetical protein BJ878DRAFT_485852 [Calycina marina]|uniref:Uncharacterized protein n=1 Tax=Calycina marina TaxID=1763456 RepID=A0A9P8CKY1_9HELO|nr:hypothetical protein BJ878DRAFT_485852 [Calycina marina]